MLFLFTEIKSEIVINVALMINKDCSVNIPILKLNQIKKIYNIKLMIIFN